MINQPANQFHSNSFGSIFLPVGLDVSPFSSLDNDFLISAYQNNNHKHLILFRQWNCCSICWQSDKYRSLIFCTFRWPPNCWLSRTDPRKSYDVLHWFFPDSSSITWLVLVSCIRELQLQLSHVHATTSLTIHLKPFQELGMWRCTIGLDRVEGIPERDAILWPFDEIFGIEITVEGLGHDIEIDVVVVEHIEEWKLSKSCHLNYNIQYPMKK